MRFSNPVSQGTPMVKAFYTTFAPTLVQARAAASRTDVFIAGDDKAGEAEGFAACLRRRLRPIDAGPLRRAQQPEQLGFCASRFSSRSASASAAPSSCARDGWDR
jgi:predicted dinucleotide-binding enzyme